MYDEESEVPEMYFSIEGKLGIGYTLLNRGLTGKQYKIVKYFKGHFIACDYYLMNGKRSEFIYMVLKPIKCFAI
jgi:hypothetical protein